jgi:hypothetical protein
MTERLHVVTITGMRLVSRANAREHWRKSAARTEQERQRLGGALATATERLPKLKAGECARVLVTRIGPRTLDDDNLQGSGKAVRDAIAEWLGVDDGDRTRFVCRVAQERGPYAVRVEILVCAGRLAVRALKVQEL